MVVILVICILLTSCQTATPFPTEATKISTNTLSVTPALATATSTKEPLTVTPTITPAQDFLVNSACPSVSNALPEGVAKGAISISGRLNNFDGLLNLENGQKVLLPNDEIGVAVVSPDRNKIAYSEHDDNLKPYLVVYVLDTHKKIKIPWPFVWSLGRPRWLNNDQIFFTLKAEDNNNPNLLHPFRNAIVNPFNQSPNLFASNRV